MKLDYEYNTSPIITHTLLLLFYYLTNLFNALSQYILANINQ